MSKTFLFKLIIGLSLVAAATLWVLSITIPETFGFFNLSWAITLFAGASGVAFILRGTFGKNDSIIKRFYIYFGAGLLVVGLLCIAPAIALPDNLILPIIAVIVAVGLLVRMIAVGGKKWDTADNQKVGYKNYHQRKAEAEKLEEKEKKKEKKK